MLKIYAIILMTVLSIGNAMACRSQIINLPDGKTMVCFYCNDGKIVNCEYL